MKSKNRILFGIILSIILLVFSINGFTAYYKYTQESGANFYVVSPDKSDALEDTNEVRQILDDLGNLLVHSKRNDLYPKDETTGGTLAIPNSALVSFATGTKGDIWYCSATNTWTKLNIGSDNQILVVATDLPNWETPSSDLLSDVASIAMLDENEAVTGAWTVTGSIGGVDTTEFGYLADISAFGGSIIDDADEATFKATVNLEIGTDVLAYQAIGIADDNLVEMDDADAAVDDYCKLTVNGIVGRSYTEVKTDLSLNLVANLKVKLDATEAPTVNNDVDEGYTIGSRWFDVTNDKEYVCLDNTDGVAVWTETTGVAGGYTDLTEFVDQNNWKVFYSDDSGDVIELALGANGTYLKSTGASSAPEFDTPAGGGVDTSGTPVDNDFAKFTDADTIEGRSYSETMKDLNPITTVTAVHTMSVDEAGTVLISCAATPYTITLPTAVGNAGLIYHFIKTDANYNLITLDADGTETINYENATSAPVLTYSRLNTLCAEATLVSDNANWQVIDEALGQVPYCHIYLGANQEDLTNGVYHKVEYDTEVTDIGNNYDISTWVSGTATSTSAGHLVDSAGAFTADMVKKRVKNTTDTTFTYITAYNSATDVTVRDDIFVDTNGYEIKNSKFVVPVPGIYNIIQKINWLSTVVINRRYTMSADCGGTCVGDYFIHAARADSLSQEMNQLFPCSKDDEITAEAVSGSGDNTVDIRGGYPRVTYFIIRLVSKD